MDDNPALLRSVERLLRMEGFAVLLAADGEQALAQLDGATSPPDLIISDIAMPKLDGFGLFEAVRTREEWLEIPFLFLTARDQIEDLRRGYSLGADDYLVKPLDQERLILIIRSKLKRRAELRERIQVQQQALDTVKRELAMVVAHELRTPLVSISMVTEILARELNRMNTEQIQELLDTMQSGSIRLTRLVEQMVMYVHLQSGAMQNSVSEFARPCYARDAVIGAIDRARQFSYRQREVPLRFDESDPDSMIKADLAALKHALAELLSNAMVFSTLDQTLVVNQWAANGSVWLAITDYGPGIPEDEMERIFVPFHQFNRRQYEQQGIGIGLPLAKGIIEAHNGTLELHSKVGHGTQVLVSLPLYFPSDLDDLD